MIIPEEKIFNNKVFVLNPNLNVESVETKYSKIFIIDDFYKNYDFVLNEIEKLPITKVLGDPRNNIDFIDGRKVYSPNMMGTSLPYQETLLRLMSRIVEHPKDKITLDTKLLVNCFKFTDRVDFENYYYGIHRDPIHSKRQVGQVAIVLFLNKEYQENEGLNFYIDNKVNSSRIRNFFKKSEWQIDYSVQAKPNRAVLFTSNMYHGQYTGSEQFKTDIRYTQVFFASLW